MMYCVIFNSAAPAGAWPLMATRRGAAAQEEKRSPTRTTARNPNVRSFTVTIPAVARERRLKAERRQSCRIIALGKTGRPNTALEAPKCECAAERQANSASRVHDALDSHRK